MLVRPFVGSAHFSRVNWLYIALYGSDFWGCLKLPKNNLVEKLSTGAMVQKSTTKNGVLFELGRVPLVFSRTKSSTEKLGKNLVLKMSLSNISDRRVKLINKIYSTFML